MFINTEDLKIIAFRYNENTFITLCENGKYDIRPSILPMGNGSHTADYILKSSYGNKICAISVKGQIFELDDEVYLIGSNNKEKYHILKMFVNVGEELQVKVKCNQLNQIVQTSPLLLTKKSIEEILLEIEDENQERAKISFESHPDEISEDGFNLYNGDDCFVINETMEIIPTKVGSDSKGIIFATRQSAEDYILYKKHLFTLEEIIDLYPKDEEKLINLAKTKI